MNNILMFFTSDNLPLALGAILVLSVAALPLYLSLKSAPTAGATDAGTQASVNTADAGVQASGSTTEAVVQASVNTADAVVQASVNTADAVVQVLGSCYVITVIRIELITSGWLHRRDPVSLKCILYLLNLSYPRIVLRSASLACAISAVRAASRSDGRGWGRPLYL